MKTNMMKIVFWLAFHFSYTRGQNLIMKRKTGKAHCPSTKAMFIVQYIHGQPEKVASMEECFKRCHDNQSNCKYFGFNPNGKYCTYFHTHLPNEIISYMVQQRWSYGRIDQSNGRLIVYKETDTCNEDFCTNSCLKGVEELCGGPFRGANCDIYEGIVDRCDNFPLVKLVGVGDQPYAKHIPGENYNIRFDGQVYSLKCLPGELTRIKMKNENNTCLNVDKCPENTEGGYVQFKPDCQSDTSIFNFDKEKGNIYSSCYGARLCIKYNTRASEGYRYRMFTRCDNHDASYKLSRTYVDSIQTENGFCIRRVDNNYTAIKRDCLHADSKIIMPNLSPAPVLNKLYEGKQGISWANLPESYPGNPLYTGRSDGASMFDVMEYFILTGEFYFVPKETGPHIFLSCIDDRLKIYLSTSDQEADSKLILDDFTLCRFNDWNHANVGQSSLIQLEKGKKYFMKFMGLEYAKWDFFSIGVKLPDGSFSRPISPAYLRSTDE